MANTPAPSLGRAVVFLAGAGVLLGAMVLSRGTVLAAPLGVWLAYRIQRSRRAPFGAAQGWIGAVSGTVVILLIVGGVLLSRVPTKTWREVQHAADSGAAAAAQKPPPAWLDRLAPGARTSYSPVRPSGGFYTAVVVWWAGIATTVLGALLGTIGWAGTMLVVYSTSGRWLSWAPAPVESL